ncbi:MAG: hypothetical protein CVU02_01435 [Bacteroidetes bacterium HGW-Bacteroidetes-19]|nr:MAG: hypothetical protein CVU02_01435 [Bacteroidetes bacterium HGW-Bacteroidetes-19]
MYAYFNGNGEGLARYEKDLFYSIDKSYDLYHLFFLLLLDVKEYAEQRTELAKNKRVPTEKDLNPNLKFIENRVIKQLTSTNRLYKYIDEKKLSWIDHPELIKKTKFIFKLINLPKFHSNNDHLMEQLFEIESGIYSIDQNQNLHNLSIPSTLLLEKYKDKLFEFGHVFYVAGAVTDSMLKLLKIQSKIDETLIIVKDFTRIFASPEIFNSYIKAGGNIQLLHKNKLIAICINPTSPSGYNLDSFELCKQLQKELNIPVYDIKKTF